MYVIEYHVAYHIYMICISYTYDMYIIYIYTYHMYIGADPNPQKTWMAHGANVLQALNALKITLEWRQGRPYRSFGPKIGKLHMIYGYLW